MFVECGARRAYLPTRFVRHPRHTLKLLLEPLVDVLEIASELAVVLGDVHRCHGVLCGVQGVRPKGAQGAASHGQGR